MVQRFLLSISRSLSGLRHDTKDLGMDGFIFSTIDSRTILIYPTYFARQGTQSVSISSRPWIKKQETVQIYLASRQDMKIKEREKKAIK